MIEFANSPSLITFFLQLMGYYIYVFGMFMVCFYFAPILIAIGNNSSYKGSVFIVNLFGFLIFPWFIALGMSIRQD